MYRIDNSTAVATLPTPQPVGAQPNGFFQQYKTVIDADWCNAIQEELAYVIEATGGTLSKTDRTQLYGALQIIASTYGGTYTLPSNLDVAGYSIISTGDITFYAGTGVININSPAYVNDKIVYKLDTTTYIQFATGAMTFVNGGSTIADINTSGFRIGGTGARVTQIDNDSTMAANSATRIPTQSATKAYIDANFLAQTSYNMPLLGYCTAGLAPSSTTYVSIGGGTSGSAPTQNSATSVYGITTPFAMTVTNLTVAFATAPGTGETYACTLYKNGSATALTATVSDSANNASDTIHSVSVDQGDVLSLEIILSSGATTSTYMTWSAFGNT